MLTLIRSILYRILLLLILLIVICCLCALGLWIWLQFGIIPILILLFLWATSQKQLGRSTSLGSARMANLIDILKSGLHRPDGFLLGEATNLSRLNLKQRLSALLFMPLWASTEALCITFARATKLQPIYLPMHRSCHAVHYASTGGGKTAGVVIPNALLDQHGIFVLDASAEILRATAGTRQTQFGQRIIVLDPTSMLDDGVIADSFNPLSWVKASDPQHFEHCRAMAGALITKTKHEMQPHFPDAAQMMLQGAIYTITKYFPVAQRTLTHLRRIFSRPPELEALILTMEQCAATDPQLANFAGQFRMPVGRERASIFTTLLVQTQWLDSPNVASSIATTNFSLNDLLEDRLSIYLLLGPENMKSFQGYIRLVFTSLTRFVFAQGPSRSRRVHFYLDEIASAGPNLESYYSLLKEGRKYGCRFFSFYQSVTQLAENFTESQIQDFHANTAAMVTAIRDRTTAEHCSKWIGRFTAVANSKQSNASSSYGHSWSTQSLNYNHNWSHSSSTGGQETVRDLYQPEEILRMSQTTTFILMPHMPAILARPVFYFKHAILRRLSSLRWKFQTTIPYAEKADPLLLEHQPLPSQETDLLQSDE